MFVCLCKGITKEELLESSNKRRPCAKEVCERTGAGKDCGSYKITCNDSGDCYKIQIFGASTDEAMAHLKLRTQKKSFTTSFYVDAHISTEPEVKLSFESVTQAGEYAELVFYLQLASTFICCVLSGLFARKMRHYKWKSWCPMQKIFPAALLLFGNYNVYFIIT